MFKVDVYKVEKRLYAKIIDEFELWGTTPARRFVLVTKFFLYILGLLVLILVKHVRGIKVSTDYPYFRPVKIPFEKRLKREYVHFLHGIYRIVTLLPKLVKGENLEENVATFTLSLTVVSSDWCSSLCGIYYEFVDD